MIDTNWFYTLNGVLGQSTLGDILIIFVAKYVIFIVCILILISLVREYGAHSWRRVQADIVRLLATVALTFVITKVIRMVYMHERPLFALSAPHILFEDSYSFPSMHTIFIFGLATATFFYNRPLAYTLYAVGVLVGMARVMAGVHYPFDILGGMILGIGAGLLIEYGTRKFLLPKRKK